MQAMECFTVLLLQSAFIKTAVIIGIVTVGIQDIW